MTRFKNVPRQEHRGVFNKAQNWLGAAHVAADMGAYDVAVSNSVHCAINAVDAITVLRVGKRSTGRHTDALELIQAVFAGRDRADLERQYSFLLGVKNPAEYESVMMTAGQAADALKCAERILARARAEIAK